MFRFSVALFVASLIFATLAAPQAKAATIRSSECKRLYAEYKRQNKNRAFALSKDGLACGWSGGYATQAQADSSALSYCRREKRSGCYIYTNTRAEAARAEKIKQAEKAKQDRKEVQRTLNALGFDAGTVDGQFGPATARAVSAFQKSIGEKQTGRLTDGQRKQLLATLKAKKAAEDAQNPSLYSTLGYSYGGSRLLRNADRTRLAVLNTEEDAIILFGSRSGEKLATLPSNTKLVAWNATGSAFAYSDLSGAVRVLDLETGETPLRIDADTRSWTALALDPTGKTLLAGDKAGRLTRITASGTAQPEQIAGVTSPIHYLEYVSQGTEILMIAEQGAVHLLVAETLMQKSGFTYEHKPGIVATSGSGEWLVLSASTAGATQIMRRTATGPYEMIGRSHLMAVYAMDILPEENELLLRQRDMITFFDLNTFSRSKKPFIRTKRSTTNALYSDAIGTVVASNGHSGVALWARNAAQKEKLHAQATHARPDDRAIAATIKATQDRVANREAELSNRVDTAWTDHDCDALAAPELDGYRGSRTVAACDKRKRVNDLRTAFKDAENKGDCEALEQLSKTLGEGADKVETCKYQRERLAKLTAFNAAMDRMDCTAVAEIAPALGKPDAPDDCRFNKAMSAETARETYFAAMKYDSANERTRARALYLQVLERFPDDDLAMRSGERLLTLNDQDRAEKRQAETERELEKLRKQAADAQAAAARARKEAERAQRDAAQAQKTQRTTPQRNRVCDGIGPSYYFRTTKQKMANAKQALGAIIGGAVYGIHWNVQYVNHDSGTAYACSEQNKCMMFSCAEIKRM